MLNRYALGIAYAFLWCEARDATWTWKSPLLLPCSGYLIHSKKVCAGLGVVLGELVQSGSYCLAQLLLWISLRRLHNSRGAH